MTSSHLISSKRFLPLFVTQFFGAFNDNAFKNAFLIWFAYDMGEHVDIEPAAMMAIAAGVFILPFFLFSGIAGQLADKYERSFLTQRIKWVEVALMILCSFFFYSNSIYGLLILLFFMGLQSTLFGPIKYSLLPEHLRKEELIQGNGLIEGGTFLSILLGTLFGGLIIRLDYGVELLSAAIICFALIGLIASYLIPKAKIHEASLQLDWNSIRNTWNIITYARKNNNVWRSILSISWFWLVGAVFLAQFPVYTKEVIHGNEHIVTLFLAIFSIGIGIGSLWCNRLLKGKISTEFVPIGALIMSIAIFCLTVFSLLYTKPAIAGSLLSFIGFFHHSIYSIFITLSLFMLAVSAGIYIVPLYAIMQYSSKARYISRIIASNNIMNALFMVIASIMTLLLSSIGFSVIELFLAVGLINLVVAIYIHFNPIKTS